MTQQHRPPAPPHPALHSITVTKLLRDEIHGLPAYDPGADPEAVAAMYGVGEVIKLSNNENPYGISPAAALAVQQLLGQGLGQYPDPVGTHLRTALARRLDLASDRILLGNGSENILELLCQTFVAPGDTVVTQTPCFGLHEIFPMMMGGHVHKVNLTPSFGIDMPAWLDSVATAPKLVIIGNPSNPSGTILNRNQLQAIVDRTPEECVLVIDEAYYEYARHDPAYPDAFALLQSRDRPWIVLRTFSKAYGLAGLRVGYAMASHVNLIDALHRVRTPYNVNQLAQAAAIAALDDTAHVQHTVGATISERDRVRQALIERGFRVAPSAANFLFIDTGRTALDVTNELLRRGVIVKPWRERGYETFIRASMGLPGHNDRFVDALTQIC